MFRRYDPMNRTEVKKGPKHAKLAMNAIFQQQVLERGRKGELVPALLWKHYWQKAQWSPARGILYDYCQVPWKWQLSPQRYLIPLWLSPLEVGRRGIQLVKKNNHNRLYNKKLRSIDMVKQKLVLGVFRHSKSKCGLIFGLPLLLHRVLTTFYPNSLRFLSVFRKQQVFE